jgi:hypothetical protein
VKYGAMVYCVRVAKNRGHRGRWTVRVVPFKARAKSEKRTLAAFVRLLKNLEYDLAECSCPPAFADTCPACELKQSLAL